MINKLYYLEFFLKLISLVKNWINIIVFKYLSFKKTITVKFRNGLKFVLNRNSPADISMMIEIFGMEFYNPPFLEIKNDYVVFDVGAHVGYFSTYASKKALKGKVFSFEPLKKNFDQLQSHLKINYCDNVVASNVALGSEDGIVEFYQYDGHNGCHSLYKRQFGQKKISVQKKTIKSVMEEYKLDRIDFLKLDCEGAEYEILFDMPDNILHKIKYISMEIHNDIVPGKTEKEMISFLMNKGFLVSSRNGYIYGINKKSL